MNLADAASPVVDNDCRLKWLGRIEGATDSPTTVRMTCHPEAVYSFKHALVQDAAYESLLKSRRQVLHRRIAETLRDRFPTIADTSRKSSRIISRRRASPKLRSNGGARPATRRWAAPRFKRRHRISARQSRLRTRPGSARRRAPEPKRHWPAIGCNYRPATVGLSCGLKATAPRKRRPPSPVLRSSRAASTMPTSDSPPRSARRIGSRGGRHGQCLDPDRRSAGARERDRRTLRRRFPALHPRRDSTQSGPGEYGTSRASIPCRHRHCASPEGAKFRAARGAGAGQAFSINRPPRCRPRCPRAGADGIYADPGSSRDRRGASAARRAGCMRMPRVIGESARTVQPPPAAPSAEPSRYGRSQGMRRASPHFG